MTKHFIKTETIRWQSCVISRSPHYLLSSINLAFSLSFAESDARFLTLVGDSSAQICFSTAGDVGTSAHCKADRPTWVCFGSPAVPHSPAVPKSCRSWQSGYGCFLRRGLWTTLEWIRNYFLEMKNLSKTPPDAISPFGWPVDQDRLNIQDFHPASCRANKWKNF